MSRMIRMTHLLLTNRILDWAMGLVAAVSAVTYWYAGDSSRAMTWAVVLVWVGIARLRSWSAETTSATLALYVQEAQERTFTLDEAKALLARAEKARAQYEQLTQAAVEGSPEAAELPQSSPTAVVGNDSQGT